MCLWCQDETKPHSSLTTKDDRLCMQPVSLGLNWARIYPSITKRVVQLALRTFSWPLLGVSSFLKLSRRLLLEVRPSEASRDVDNWLNLGVAIQHQDQRHNTKVNTIAPRLTTFQAQVNTTLKFKPIIINAFFFINLKDDYFIAFNFATFRIESGSRYVVILFFPL